MKYMYSSNDEKKIIGEFLALLKFDPRIETAF